MWNTKQTLLLFAAGYISQHRVAKFIFRMSVNQLQIKLEAIVLNFNTMRSLLWLKSVRLQWMRSKFKRGVLRHVTAFFVCVCVFGALLDGRGGFPKDDPGGRKDGRWRAARKNILLHDVEPPNQHTGHCTGISRYLKASCQFSSTSTDSTPRVLNIQYCLFMALIPLLFISIPFCHPCFSSCVW